jgi:hypothetical protein
MLPKALLCHQTTGRFRVRIPEKRKDDAYFACVKAAIEQLPSVVGVETSAMTGSVLVVHTGDCNELLRQAERAELFRRTEETPQTRTIVHWLDQLDRFDSDFLFARMEQKPQRAATGLFMLAVLQVIRGSIIPSAPSLLGEAMSLLRKARAETERTKDRDGDD